MSTTAIVLTMDQMLVLQQIYEDFEDDIENLMRSMRLNRGQLHGILESLKRKGLLIFEHRKGQGMPLVRVSQRGRRLIADMWGSQK
ncbi:hypothetical protein CR970_04635 [Candidatus Saccharibacteria bacterium]|nr:MAG: hypothetical protein CR970_04635 [Candidatus Saccharibacteria bacterium]